MATPAQEKFELGKLATKLDINLECLLNKFSDYPLEERAALAEGVVSGLLENSHLEAAFKFVYNPGPINGLVNISKFPKEVIETVKRCEEESIPISDSWPDKTRRRLFEHWAPEDIYELITQPAIKSEDALEILNNLITIAPEKKASAYNLFAERFFKKEEFHGAYALFEAAKNKEKISDLYNTLIKKITADNIGLLVDIAATDEDVVTRNDRLVNIMRKVLGDKKAQHERSVALRLYELNHKYQLLPVNETMGLVELAAKVMDGYDVKKTQDSVLELTWAKIHAKDRPAEAYRMLKKAQYAGPEIVMAAKQGIIVKSNNSDNRNALSVEEVDKEHLKIIFNKCPLDIRVRIAELLDDKEEMLRLSKKLHGKGDLRESYSLWIKGGGEQDCTYVNELRQALIQRELQASYIGTGWLSDKDIAGHMQFYKAVLEKSPRTAYALASRINDQKLVQDARFAIVAQSPEHAFGFFAQEKDEVGRHMAEIKLAQKYSLNSISLTDFLQPLIRE
ncbi:MAG: hypothetical protein NTY99_03070 [DPANN group archaeon]|nr:hypothetical protein [DPANN group archaeon]